MASATAGASFANQICSAVLGGSCDCHVGGEGTAAVASDETGSAQFASIVMASLVEAALSAFRPRVLPASASPRARVARPPEAATVRRGRATASPASAAACSHSSEAAWEAR
eukprot:scaffold112554_cov63-Phaeocystis_antarctica.AAC.5